VDGHLAGLVLAVSFGMAPACAGPRALGGGGPVYDVIVHSINDRATALAGPPAHPAVTLQVADTVQRVWFASAGKDASSSPPVLRADAAALKAGILVEIDWRHAIVHEVTAEELAAGGTVVLVAGLPDPRAVELRFVPVSTIATRTVVPRRIDPQANDQR
jgi:hypothetical protein